MDITKHASIAYSIGVQVVKWGKEFLEYGIKPAETRMAQKYYGEIEGSEFADGYKNMTADQVALFEIVIERVTAREV